MVITKEDIKRARAAMLAELYPDDTEEVVIVDRFIKKLKKPPSYKKGELIIVKGRTIEDERMKYRAAIYIAHSKTRRGAVRCESFTPGEKGTFDYHRKQTPKERGD